MFSILLSHSEHSHLFVLHLSLCGFPVVILAKTMAKHERPGYPNKWILCFTLDSQRVFKTLIAMGTRNLLNCSDLQENPISNDMLCHCSFAQLGGYEESFCRCSFSLFNVSIYTTVLSESSLLPNTELDFLSIRMNPQHTSALKRALATTLW